MQGEI
ncbi:Protein of unknown function [Bacillus wiedmannii]